MALSESIISRLRHQHTVIPDLIANLSKVQLEQHPVPGKWSALEQIAHLAAYQPVFIDRLKKMSARPAALSESGATSEPIATSELIATSEPIAASGAIATSGPIQLATPIATSGAIIAPSGIEPTFERYVADNDPHFHECTTWSPEQLTQSLLSNGKLIAGTLENFNAQTLQLKGRHPRYGLFDIAEWTEFYLLHEAHHLFHIFMLTKSVHL